MRVMKRTVMVVGLLLVIGSVGGAQASRPAGLEDVVAELRALRADLNQTASVTVRTQLLVVRLQLQEQRIASVSRQLNEVQKELGAVQNGNAHTAAQLKDQEERLLRASLEDRLAIEAELKQVKPMLEQAQRREQALQLQANELAGMLATEQNRWSDFNDRIDGLERSLSVK